MSAAVGMGGYEADPEAARALAAAELEPVFEGWPGDPLAQYAAITSRLATWQAAGELIAGERARIVAQMSAGGMSYQKIADALGMSRARAQQLCETGRDVSGGR